MKVTSEHYQIMYKAIKPMTEGLDLNKVDQYGIYHLWSTYTIVERNKGNMNVSFYFDEDRTGYIDDHILTACRKLLKELQSL